MNKHNVDKNDLLAYTPLDPNIEEAKKIDIHYLGIT